MRGDVFSAIHLEHIAKEDPEMIQRALDHARFSFDFTDILGLDERMPISNTFPIRVSKGTGVVILRMMFGIGQKKGDE